MEGLKNSAISSYAEGGLRLCAWLPDNNMSKISQDSFPAKENYQGVTKYTGPKLVSKVGSIIILQSSQAYHMEDQNNLRSLYYSHHMGCL